MASTPHQAERLLAIDGGFEVVALLDRAMATWLEGLAEVPARLALRQPTYERLTESRERDVADPRALFARLPQTIPVEGIPACVTGRPPRERPRTLDTAMLDGSGKPEIFRYAKRYIVDRYRTRSLRCKGCVHEASCEGLHVSYVRAHGYSVLQPILP